MLSSCKIEYIREICVTSKSHNIYFRYVERSKKDRIQTMKICTQGVDMEIETILLIDPINSLILH